MQFKRVIWDGEWFAEFQTDEALVQMTLAQCEEALRPGTLTDDGFAQVTQGLVAIKDAQRGFAT